MSSELLGKMDVLLKNEVVSRHSYFQMKYFIIGKEPTHQSKLWQCLRELKVRRESMKAIFLEIDDTNDKLALLDIEHHDIVIKSTEPVSGDIFEQKNQQLDKMEQQIKLRRISRQRAALLETIGQLREKLKNNEEEARFFMQAFEGLEKIEKLKSYDDLEAQKEYWNERLSQDINMKLMLQHPIDTELMKTIMALHNDAPIKQQAIHILDSQQARMEMLRHKEPNE